MAQEPSGSEEQAHRQVAEALRTGGPAPPPELLVAVRQKVQDAYGPARAHQRGERSPRRLTLAAPVLAAVCAAVAAVLVISIGGTSAAPSIPAAARLALAPATGPAPATRNARFLDVSYGGVTYPSYARFDVPPTGIRTDRIGGRPALTVFYRLRSGAPMSYTVFSGKPVGLPRSARRVVYDGVPLTTFSTRPGISVVTLVRFGRTCVLAGRTPRDVLLALAAAPVREQSV
jgi:hypothetical protein